MAIVFARVSSLMSFANRISPGLCFGPVAPAAAFAAASFSCLSFAEKSLIISRRPNPVVRRRPWPARRCASGCACALGERAPAPFSTSAKNTQAGLDHSRTVRVDRRAGQESELHTARPGRRTPV
jgi:hypothetical protein